MLPRHIPVRAVFVSAFIVECYLRIELWSNREVSDKNSSEDLLAAVRCAFVFT